MYAHILSRHSTTFILNRLGCHRRDYLNMSYSFFGRHMLHGWSGGSGTYTAGVLGSSSTELIKQHMDDLLSLPQILSTGGSMLRTTVLLGLTSSLPILLVYLSQVGLLSLAPTTVLPVPLAGSTKFVPGHIARM